MSKTIIGSYELIRQIGEGGFGRTYEGRHVLLPEVKACLKQNISINLEDTKLLQREAGLLAKIHHHSLPTFRDLVRVDDGSYVLIMSYIEGKGLEKAIAKHHSIHPEDVSWITQRLLNALHYLHHMGMIHGDVKPPNIIVQPEKHNAYLVDYGLATFQPKAGTKPDGYTPIFVPPEIKEGKPPLPVSDLYSLGLSMIFALGGNPLTKEMPDHVPSKLQDFYKEMTQFDPLQRTSWEKEDLVKKLSSIRDEVFGRKTSYTG